ncbi:MAG: hypothetical protein ACYC61_17430 [Isosphaeraceae bacterium]
MPTATDEKLGEQIHEVAESLAGFRLEMAERFGALETTFEGFRSKVDTHLQFIKWLGVFFAGILVAVVVGSGRVVWDAATVNSELKQQGRVLETLASEVRQQGTRLEQQGRVLETLASEVKQQGRVLENLGSEVKQQGTRLERFEGRLDAVQKQLETLVNRPAPKPGG